MRVKVDVRLRGMVIKFMLVKVDVRMRGKVDVYIRVKVNMRIRFLKLMCACLLTLMFAGTFKFMCA